MTAPLEVRTATPKLVHAPQVVAPTPPPAEIREEVVVPVIVPPAANVEESKELPTTDDQVEMVKATYEDQIAKLHDSYQYIFIFF